MRLRIELGRGAEQCRTEPLCRIHVHIVAIFEEFTGAMSMQQQSNTKTATEREHCGVAVETVDIQAPIENDPCRPDGMWGS